MSWLYGLIGGGLFANALALVRIGVYWGRMARSVEVLSRDQAASNDAHTTFERRLDDHGNRIARLETFHEPPWTSAQRGRRTG